MTGWNWSKLRTLSNTHDNIWSANLGADLLFLKIIFALVPPAGILGGWLTFFVSMFVIGFITAIIGDFASLFGCLIGMPDSVTGQWTFFHNEPSWQVIYVLFGRLLAITFVALGTSLPDLFASKAAACQEKHADNAIGNITGSNSVNVFLGLGLPWVIASMYHASQVCIQSYFIVFNHISSYLIVFHRI